MRTVSANYLKNYVDICVEQGCPAGELLDMIPGGKSTLSTPTARIPIETVFSILKKAEKITGNGAIGIACGKNFRPENFELVGQAMMFSKSLRHASAIINRYQPLFQQLGRSYITIEGKEAWNYWDCHFTDAAYAKHVTEATLISHAQFGRWLTWKHDMPIEFVHFRHKQPDYHEAYQETFNCPIFYEQERDAVVFEASLIDFPLPQANQELLDGICDKLDYALSLLDAPKTYTEKTEQTTYALIKTGTPDLTKTAKSLGISVRSLRRHLAQEGTSYRAVLEEVRRKLCEQYMLDHRIPLGEIAERLGYSEQSAFNRAFKKWFGKTPKAYAKAMKVFNTAFDQLAPKD